VGTTRYEAKPDENRERVADRVISSRLFCYPKALWKLSWFLRDFGYDAELIGRDEVDERPLVGLTGVVKITHIVKFWVGRIRITCTSVSADRGGPRSRLR